ncbi:MAG: NAD-dependent epimerase/dehydratase family protein [Oscillospiraceae bacterium]|nr:NAD-dependent epimerase/dehydratase family protein [Oscillospiraceae bacterium]
MGEERGQIAVRNILVTGGTVFVSRFTAEYFAAKGDNVFVLNRGNRPQPEDVTPIICDRCAIGTRFKGKAFDLVVDVSAYTRADAEKLVTAIGDFGCYIFISSGAVYPETLPLPFREEQKCGRNSVWGDYGANKLDAENFLLENVGNAYIVRPPYLYGRYENLYRAPYIFDCADMGQPVYVPREDLPLQFFNVYDLCRFIEILYAVRPAESIFNVGDPDTVTVGEWVRICFEAAGKSPEIRIAPKDYFARNYFCFYDMDYRLDVSRMRRLMPDVKPLAEGIREEYEWYKTSPDAVLKRSYFEYINENLCGR